MKNRCFYAQTLVKYFVLVLYLNIISSIKMRILTYTSYKEHFELHSEICELRAVNCYQIELFKKDKIVLRDNIFIKYSKSLHSVYFVNRHLFYWWFYPEN